MALIACSQCGKNISDQAKQCPHCGKSYNSKVLRSLKICLLYIFGTQALKFMIILILPFIVFRIDGNLDHLIAIQNVCSLLSDIIITCSFGYILSKNIYQMDLLGKIGVILSLLIYAFYVIGDIFNFLTLDILIPIKILSLISIGLLLYDIKISKYIQLVGVISYIPYSLDELNF